MVYRELKKLEDSGYSARKIGYVLTRSVLDIRRSKSLSGIVTIEDRVRQGIPEAKARKAEKNVKGHFLVCLGQKISILSENPEYRKGHVPADELAREINDGWGGYRPDSVEWAVVEGITGAKDVAMYLTKVGKRALEYLGNYHDMLTERRRVIEEEPRQWKKSGKKKGKAKKRPNYMTNRQEIYQILRRIFTG